MRKRMINNITCVSTSECVGCGACADACPKNCIKICSSQNDFALHPIVGVNCIDCGHCKSVCPALNYSKKLGTDKCYPKVYAFKNRLDIRLNSSSGGAFYSLAKEYLDNGGIVYGAAFADSSFNSVEHIAITEIADLQRLQGSKYIQSRTGQTYSEIKHLLSINPNTKILFSGTPCQVAALKSFLKNEYANLLTVDIVCHGVGSELLFSKYLMENFTHYKKIAFRDKHVSPSCTNIYLYDLYNNVKIVPHTSPFEIAFHRSLVTRLSCLNCKYATIPRVADISLGDFWGLTKIESGKFKYFYDNKGVSLVMVNSRKGEMIFEKIKKIPDIEVVKIENKDFVKYNSFGARRTPKGDRKSFYANIMNCSFLDAVSKSMNKNNALSDKTTSTSPLKQNKFVTRPSCTKKLKLIKTRRLDIKTECSGTIINTKANKNFFKSIVHCLKEFFNDKKRDV